MDDEAEIAEVLGEMLAADGHRAETVTSGEAALARIAATTFDLVLADIRMPGIDGPTLYTEVSQRHPALARRMIFMTGDTLSDRTRAFPQASGAASLSKPITPADLRAALRSARRREGEA